MRANEFDLVMYPVKESKPNGPCKIVLTQRADGKILVKDEWICPNAEEAIEELARIAAKAAKTMTSSNSVIVQAQNLLPKILGNLGLGFEFIPNPTDDPLEPTEEDRKKAKDFVDEVSKVRN